MKKKLFMPLAALALLAGCDYNDKNFDGLEEMTQPKDVFKKEYVMTDADYALVASNKTNMALAKEDGVSDELKNVSTNKYLTSMITAEKYLPAFFASKYYTADAGSAVKVTYNVKTSLPEYVNKLNATAIYTLAATDYQAAWGDKSTLNFFTPAKPAAKYLAAILTDNVTDPSEGQIVCAAYNESSAEPAAMTVAFKEDFETATNKADLALENWTNTTVKGTAKWQARSFDGNLYANQSAFRHDAGDLDSYLISKEIGVEKGMSLTFDALYANQVAGGGTIAVLISTNLTDAATAVGINAAKWDDLTAKFTIPASTTNSGDLGNAGAADLSAYVGKKVRIAFRYQGNNTTATSTIRLDNVSISTPGKNTYLLVNALYTYNSEAWVPYTTANVLMLSTADFNLMGSKYDNFSTTMNPDNYLPTLLNQRYPFAQENDTKVPVYKFYNSATKVTTVRADEYIFTEGKFVKNSAIETVTDQFVFSEGKWKFDPSVVITLSTSKGDKETSLFYQTITDWVKINKGAQYVTSFGNNDYYYGGSAYNNNFDFRPSAWKAQSAAEYGDMSDADLTLLMFKRLPEAFVPALKVLYPDAKQVEGVEVMYTINFSIYNGTTTTAWSIIYQVTGAAEFTYVEDSLKENK